MFFSIIIPALVQSLTEFLPISSSGHLILLEKFQISPQTLVMDIALHVGTLLAVMIYFWRDIRDMIWGIFQKGYRRDLLKQVIIATIPIVIIGFFLKTVIEDTFRSVVLIACTSVFYGILLWCVDAYAPRTKTFREITLKSAFFIGCAQVLSLIPGTSRSGITMTCARLLGISREASARFSMLLSVPAIAFGAMYVLFCAWRDGQLSGTMIDQIGAGIIWAGLFGFLVIWGLMKWIKYASFAIFGIYRVILGGVLIGYLLF